MADTPFSLDKRLLHVNHKFMFKSGTFPLTIANLVGVRSPCKVDRISDFHHTCNGGFPIIKRSKAAKLLSQRTRNCTWCRFDDHFVKPLPKYLLSYSFWETYLLSKD